MGVSFSLIPEALHCLLKKSLFVFAAPSRSHDELGQRQGAIWSLAAQRVEDTETFIAYLDTDDMNIVAYNFPFALQALCSPVYRSSWRVINAAARCRAGRTLTFWTLWPAVVVTLSCQVPWVGGGCCLAHQTWPSLRATLVGPCNVGLTLRTISISFTFPIQIPDLHADLRRIVQLDTSELRMLLFPHVLWFLNDKNLC